MSSDAELRRLAREVLGDLVPELARARAADRAPAHGNGHGREAEPMPVAQVPAPPVAAVLRPSTWPAPPVPGEVVGDRVADEPAPRPTRTAAPPPDPGPASEPSPRLAPAPLPGEQRTEVVVLHDDEDLANFVRSLSRRLENARDRLAIRTGRLRFALDRGRTDAAGGAAPAPAPAKPAMRVERGAVTERVVRRAADDGARLVLAPAAVLTPLGRELAGSLHVEIERERRC